jgi:GNAT superfamily N-acetyltransferase
MASEFTAREYRSGDEVQIVELLKETFPHWATRKNPVDYWLHKYPKDKSKTYIAEANDRIIAVVSYVLCRVKVGEQSYLSTFGDDLATHPDYRGKGVTKKTGEVRFPWEEKIGLKLSYVITTNPIIVDSARRANAKELPYKSNHLIIIKDVNLYLKQRHLNTSIIGPGLSLIKSFSSLGTKRLEFIRDFIVEKMPFDARIDVFWEKARTQFNFVIEKTYDHLSWRYQPALSDYIIIQAVKNDEVLGFAVLEYKREDDYLEGYITDFITLPGRTDVATALIEDSLIHFEEQYVNAIHYRDVKGHPYEYLFRNMGFIEPPKMLDMYMIIYYKDPSMHEPVAKSKSDQIYFSYGDYL